MTKIIKGAGGGGKGGDGEGRTPVESPDSLRSIQYANVIDLLSEGEIEGLVDGSRSIFLDDTPLQNADGSFNFTGVTVQTRNGTQSQSYIPGFAAAEAENAVGIEVTQALPVVRSITNSNNTAVRVTLSVPTLTVQSTETGDITGSSVEVAIDIQTDGGGWVAQPLRKIYQAALLAISSSGAVSTVDSNQYTIDVTWTGQNVQAPQTLTFELQYRIVGNPTWTTSQSYTFTGGSYVNTGISVITAPNVNYANGKKTFNLTLPEETYEFRVVKTNGSLQQQGSIVLGQPQIIPYVGMAYGGSVAITGGSVYAPAYTDVISGKTTSKYQRAYRIPLPVGDNWDIRIRRITADSVSSLLNNKTFWDSYTEIIDGKLTYPNSAIIATQIDAKQFSRIPVRGFEIRGIKCQIPSNYDPLVREYTGAWDGTFTVAWTNNPAWVWYDIVTNDRYGLGELITEEMVDKWSLYSIAQYCDEMVEDGFGGIEPRFTCNLYLQTREQAYQVIMNIASIFRAMTYWAASTIFVSQDAPKSPTQIFTAANVIDGMFNYVGSSGRVRHTVALITWNDPQDNYLPRVEYVSDNEAIARYGIIQTNLVAIGCTSRGQAARMGRWLLYSEQYETETISFKAGIDSVFLQPGDVIQTQDSNRSGLRLGGRLKSGSMEISNISLASYTEKSFSIGAQEATPAGIHFKPDGTKFFVTGGAGDDVNEYALSAAWDLSTASYTTVKTLGGLDASPNALFISDDGKLLYMGGSTTDSIYQYALTTAWDITTLTYTGKSFSIAAKELTIGGIYFNNEGTNLFITGTASDSIHSYDLSVAWDITTAVYAKTKNISTQDTAPQDIVFNQDGSKLFVVGSTNDKIYQYNLTTPWDISSATYLSDISVSSQDSAPTCLYISGPRIYMCGQATDTIYEYLAPFTINIDNPITINGSKDYELSVKLPDGSIETRNVTNSAGVTSQLTIDYPFNQLPLNYGMWMVSVSDLIPESWRIISMAEIDKTQVEITALSYREDKYLAVEDGLMLEALPTSIINGGIPETPSNLTITESLYLAGVGVVGVKATVSWNSQLGINSYILVYTKEGENPATFTTSDNTVDIQPLSEGNYTFTLYAVNRLGRRSQAQTSNITINGKTTPPSDVDNFQVNSLGSVGLFTWNPATDLDVIVGGKVYFRFSPNLLSTWDTAADLVNEAAGSATTITLPLQSGVYFAKFVDSSGNLSTNATSIITNTVNILALNFVEILTGEPDWTGAKVNTAYYDDLGGLMLTSSDLWDSADLMDSAETMDFGGGVASFGTYALGEIDLGHVQTSRISMLVDARGIDFLDTWDASELMDSVSLMDGDVVDDVYALIYYRSTNDDPSLTPVWSAWQTSTLADVSARAFEFELRLSTDALFHNVLVESASAKIDMPDRIESGDNIISGTLPYVVIYGLPFIVNPALALSIENMDTGDYYELSNKDQEGFTIQFFNVGGVAISRTFDYIAKGY